MIRLLQFLKDLRLGLGISIASALTLTASAPAMAGFVRIEGTGFSLQLGDRPAPAQQFIPNYQYIHPQYNYYQPHIHPTVPHFYHNYLHSQPVTPSIIITPQGTSIILPSRVIQRSSQRFYYYGF
jgi:hypothetical protein